MKGPSWRDWALQPARRRPQLAVLLEEAVRLTSVRNTREHGLAGVDVRDRERLAEVDREVDRRDAARAPTGAENGGGKASAYMAGARVVGAAAPGAASTRRAPRRPRERRRAGRRAHVEALGDRGRRWRGPGTGRPRPARGHLGRLRVVGELGRRATENAPSATTNGGRPARRALDTW